VVKRPTFQRRFGRVQAPQPARDDERRGDQRHREEHSVAQQQADEQRAGRGGVRASNPLLVLDPSLACEQLERRRATASAATERSRGFAPSRGWATRAADEDPVK
jgi:hypothetical protein